MHSTTSDVSFWGWQRLHTKLPTAGDGSEVREAVPFPTFSLAPRAPKWLLRTQTRIPDRLEFGQTGLDVWRVRLVCLAAVNFAYGVYGRVFRPR